MSAEVEARRSVPITHYSVLIEIVYNRLRQSVGCVFASDQIDPDTQLFSGSLGDRADATDSGEGQ